MFDKKKLKHPRLIALAALILGLLGGNVINVLIRPNVEQLTSVFTLELSDEQIPALIEDDKGEFYEDNIPTVEEVDGGRFEDETTGVSVNSVYADLGWSETYDTSTPEAFRNDTIGRCIRANNKFGSQCVSLARVFWWSYADRDVSTCGTGMAKGMMNCAEENAEDDFLIFWADSKHDIQAGDWLVFDGGQYGHVGMALGGDNNGYVALLGENQGGHACEGGGAATNIINISLKNLIGFYRPKGYIKVTPEPEPLPISNCLIWHVKRGDTMTKIMATCEGFIEYGQVMDDYARTWYSLIVKPNQSVYDGWNSATGVGLYADDDIEHRF